MTFKCKVLASFLPFRAYSNRVYKAFLEKRCLTSQRFISGGNLDLWSYVLVMPTSVLLYFLLY